MEPHRGVVLPVASRSAFRVPENADDLWKLFLSNKAENTRVNHATDLRCFATFAGVADTSEAIRLLLKCNAAEANKTVLEYQAWLYKVRIYRRGDDPGTSEPVQIGYAPATVNRRIYALRAVVELANTCGIVSWTIKVKPDNPETRRDTRGCGVEGYTAILAALEKSIQTSRKDGQTRDLTLGLRDRALFRLLHDGGLRRKEAIAIEWPIGVRLEAAEVQILGKGRKRYEWHCVGRLCAQTIEEWLAVRGATRGFLLTSTHPSYRGNGLALSTVNRRVKFWADRASQQVTPHGLRHTAATRALDLTGGDYRLVAQWSRHLNPDTLRNYDDRRQEFARKLVDVLADPTATLPPDSLSPLRRDGSG